MRNRYLKITCLVASIFFALLLVKCIWVNNKCTHIGSLETEYEDIIQRRNYLIEKVIVSPDKLLEEMPAAVGPQFQGEWALYSCSMLSAALTNIATIITTNLPFTRWEEIMKDRVLCSALVDRLCHKAYLVNMTGKSYRIRETQNMFKK